MTQTLPIHLTPGGITSQKTDAELRALIMESAHRHAGWQGRHKCLITRLSGLTYASRHNLVSGFSREHCLEILASDCFCLTGDLAS